MVGFGSSAQCDHDKRGSQLLRLLIKKISHFLLNVDL